MTKLETLEALLVENHYDAAAMGISPNMNWMTGVDKGTGERPTTLLIRPGYKPALIIPAFELPDALETMQIPFEPFPFGDDPLYWGEAFEKAGKYLKLDHCKIAAEPVYFRLQEYLFLSKALPSCEIVDGSAMYAELRMRKTADDVAKISKAVTIAQEALEATLKIAKIGVSERELFNEMSLQLIRHGSSANFPFNPIIVSGPNAANPHADSGERVLQRGDFLLIDWGARYQGFCSDLTRTFIMGEASDKQIEVYNTVLAANRAGLAAVAPGKTCGSLDQAARKVITDAGYGEYFTHRLGHGMGMEDHEAPYIFGANQQILEEGMVFSDEPGIYIDGWGGVRIEDDLIVTADAGRYLTDYPRELRIL